MKRRFSVRQLVRILVLQQLILRKAQIEFSLLCPGLKTRILLRGCVFPKHPQALGRC